MSELDNGAALFRHLHDLYGPRVRVRKQTLGGWSVDVAVRDDLFVAADVDQEAHQVRVYLGRFTFEGLTPPQYEDVLNALSRSDFALRHRRLTGTLELRVQASSGEQTAYASVGAEGLEAWEQAALDT
ncbi:hypothetical protein ACF1AY_10915 [Streptomyces sp. NPDC014776]|uniref:hypothetical protein n=1 Tax=unclassified Streptomyces TaxID=2593676 RepID=UPI0036FAB3B3